MNLRMRQVRMRPRSIGCSASWPPSRWSPNRVPARSHSRHQERASGGTLPISVRSTVLLFGSENFWTTWGDLLHCVRTGETAFSHLFGVGGTFDFLTTHPEDAALFNAGMGDVAALTAKAIIASYDFSSAHVVVDVGGGRGALISAILNAHPRLRGVLFDLPRVVEAARGELERFGDRQSLRSSRRRYPVISTGRG